MKKLIVVAAIAAFVAFPFTVMAGSNGIDKCIESVQKVKKGDIIKLESLDMQGKSIYEIEVVDENGFEWEFMCDAETGKIIETEREASSPDSKDFKAKAKITEEDALKIALKAYPGIVEEVEYEIEANNDPTYEIDIMGENGVETKVEVDAVTGKIIEVYTEKWEIGVEEDETR
jgi:uncharacterized membrane protein YkoI